MEVLFSFGVVSAMLLIGVLLRSKISFFKKMLIPATVIGGIIGFILMNVGMKNYVPANMLTEIVNQLFTISFISIGLTSAGGEKNSKKNIMKGTIGMGVIWCILYAITPIIGALLIMIIGSHFNFNTAYGMMIQFGFAQGPGQAASFGTLFEQYGFENASTVGLTFAAIGFLVAFLVGIIIIRKGMKSGLIKNSNKIDDDTLNGYYKKGKHSLGKETTCSSNIDTLSFHLAIIGICYVLAIGIAKVFELLPGFLGNSMSGMMFMNGMIAAYIVKFIIKKLKLDFLLDDNLQRRITSLATDYLVVSAFMSIELSIVNRWIIPIIVECIIVTIITVIVCLYFGRRIGGENDFERTLGLYGTCTGTVPSGISLIRIINPELNSTTSVELGMMNITMMLSTPVYMLILAYASNTINLTITLIGLVIMTIIYLIILKVTKCWGKPTYSFKKE